MGKEHDLLEAARTGNVAVIEKILSQRQKRMGQLHVPLALQAPFASLTRSANPNCVDGNGDTPLHLAALNGHGEAVSMLLQHGSTANIADTKGCLPLHLAAWNGNSRICRTLLTQGPSIAKVDEENAILETALHCASQYGHTNVVDILLQYHADPLRQNHHQETALDLACQYGRLDSVQMLLSSHPTLQCEGGLSPLHLASRNGHRAVVKALLDAGFNVNTKTESGSALHEASLFGKIDVVRLLLDNAVDTGALDGENRTTLDILSEQKSHISLDIGNLILDHTEGEDSLYRRSQFLASPSSSGTERGDPHHHGDDERSTTDVFELYARIPRRGSPEAGRISNTSVTSSMGSAGSSSTHEEAPPVPPKLLEPDDSLYDVPVPSARVQEVLKRNLAVASSPLRPVSEPNLDGATMTLSPLASSSCQSMIDCSAGKLKTPKKPPRRHPPSPKPKSGSGGGAFGEEWDAAPEKLADATPGDVGASDNRENEDDKQTASDNREQDGCQQVAPAGGTAAALPQTSVPLPSVAQIWPHATAPPVELTTQLTCASPLGVETAALMAPSRLTTGEALSPQGGAAPGTQGGAAPRPQGGATPGPQRGAEPGPQRGAAPGTQGGGQHRQPAETPGGDGSYLCDSNDSLDVDGSSSSASSRPPSLELVRPYPISELPLSPTGYAQPPTPDHPPPSPTTAVIDIQERINPDEKRKSRDIETWTDAMHGGSPRPTQGVLAPTPGALAEEGGAREGADSSSGRDTPDDSLPPLTPGGAKGPDAAREDIEIIRNKNNAFLEDDLSPPLDCLRKGSISLSSRRGNRTSASEAVLTRPHAATISRQMSAPELMNAGGGATGGGATGGGANEGRATGDGATRGRANGDGANEGGANGGGEMTGGSREDGLLDENKEWEKIADILSSCGGRMSMAEFNDYGYFEKRLLQIFAHPEKDGAVMQSVGDWLESIGLPQYENTLVANGFDDMDFMGSNILSRDDLLELNITDPDHQRCILDAARQLPVPDVIGQLQSDGVRESSLSGVPESSLDGWLGSLRLPGCSKLFRSRDVTTREKLSQCSPQMMKQIVEFLPLGHRKRILASVLRRPVEGSTAESLRENTKAFHTVGSPPRGGSGDPAAPPHPSEGVGTGACPLTPSDTPSQGEVVCPHGGGREEEVGLSLRPPHHAHAASPVREWRHHPEVLVRGCCNYTAQYLGSTLVKNIQGIESTKDSITKMKKSFTNASKILIIILSISYQGVKFIDAKSKRVICEHAISNIFCASQDGVDLRCFAYITKDLMSDRHYCHVFSVRSTELATEIILTLGEAFEVAYQMALRGRSFDPTPRSPEGRPPVTETSF